MGRPPGRIDYEVPRIYQRAGKARHEEQNKRGVGTEIRRIHSPHQVLAILKIRKLREVAFTSTTKAELVVSSRGPGAAAGEPYPATTALTRTLVSFLFCYPKKNDVNVRRSGITGSKLLPRLRADEHLKVPPLATGAVCFVNDQPPRQARYVQHERQGGSWLGPGPEGVGQLPSRRPPYEDEVR